MPLIQHSTYPGPPRWQINGHWQTIIPAMRRGFPVAYERERIITPDGDFLDMDWIRNGHRRLAILTHGLEGSSYRPYVKAMARWYADRDWDILAWNNRSCSGEMNQTARLYHHGEISDFAYLIDRVVQQQEYDRIVLIGFSMGGNITLKYLGVHGAAVPPVITHGIAFSSPTYLEPSVDSLEVPGNGIYKRRFYRALREKLLHKATHHPELELDVTQFDRIRTWRDFDEFFSAPLNGYATASDFYEIASAANFMENIARPALLVNAINDPMVPAACNPVDLCREHPDIYLERPQRGGHVGFEVPGLGLRHSWMEERAWAFTESH